MNNLLDWIESLQQRNDDGRLREKAECSVSGVFEGYLDDFVEAARGDADAVEALEELIRQEIAGARNVLDYLWDVRRELEAYPQEVEEAA